MSFMNRETSNRTYCVLQVYPTPTIAVLSTGDELVEPTTACLSRGQVLHVSENSSFTSKVHIVGNWNEKKKLLFVVVTKF